MRFEFDIKLSDQDYFNFNKYHIYHSSGAKYVKLMRFIVPALLLGIAGFMVSIGNTSFIRLFSFGFVGAIAFLWLIFYSRLLDFQIKCGIKRTRRDGKLYDENTHVIFDEDGFSAQTDETIMQGGYDRIERFGEGKEAYYIYISAVVAHVIPFSVFGGAGDSQKDAFRQFIERKISEKGLSKTPVS